MIEISSIIYQQDIPSSEVEKLVTTEMAKAVFGSNNINRLGVGLDKTMRLCLVVFEGGNDIDIPNRYVRQV